MSRKTEAAYTAVFKYLHENVMPLHGLSFMSDYEKALRNGFSNVVPNLHMSACWFHFTQACKRKAMKLPKMIKSIRADKKAESIYRQLLCLPLLPAQEIEGAFAMLKLRALASNLIEFQDFFKYYEHQWLIKVNCTYFTLKSKMIIRNVANLPILTFISIFFLF